MKILALLLALSMSFAAFPHSGVAEGTGGPAGGGAVNSGTGTSGTGAGGANIRPSSHPIPGDVNLNSTDNIPPLGTQATQAQAPNPLPGQEAGVAPGQLPTPGPSVPAPQAFAQFGSGLSPSSNPNS